MIGKILKVPLEIAESGYIKIVADQRHCSTEITKWKLLAVAWNAAEEKMVGSAFQVTEEEIGKWINQ